jgi:hypothetical protein
MHTGTTREAIMVDFGDTLATEAAKQIVMVLAAGLIGAVKKISRLWERAGSRKQKLIEHELQRSALALRDAGDDPPAARDRQEGAWEARLRDLLAEHPEVAADLRDTLEVLRHQAEQLPQATVQQNITAVHGNAMGALHGNVIYHHDAPGLAAPKVAPGMESRDQEERGDLP